MTTCTYPIGRGEKREKCGLCERCWIRARSHSVVAEGGVVGQHRRVAARLGEKMRCAALALLVAGLLACEPTVTSVGAWETLVTQPQGGSAGAGVAGAGGAVAGGGAGGMGATSGSDAGGAPEPTGFYVEAESGELSGDFVIGSDATASNGAYLQAPPMVVADEAPGGSIARYQLEIAKDGEYIIWGRIYSPDIYSNRFWIQVDGGTWYRWRITVGTIWYWDDLHDDLSYNQPLLFQWSAGSHTLLIANEAPDTRLDRLYITADGDEPPGNMTKCRPPHSIDSGGAECELSCGAQAPAGMHTSCECGDRLDVFDAYDCGSGTCCVVPP